MNAKFKQLEKNTRTFLERNFMNIEILEALKNKNETKVFEAFEKENDLSNTLKSFTLFALHEKTEVKNRSAIQLTNALRDLQKFNFNENLEREVFEWALKLLLQMEFEEMNKELIMPNPSKIGQSIYIGDFEYALRTANLEESFNLLTQSMQVTDSRNFLIEIILGSAVSNFDDECQTIRFVNSCCRTLGLFSSKFINFIFYPCIQELCKTEIGYVELPEHIKPEIDFEKIFEDALRITDWRNDIFRNLVHLEYIHKNVKVKPIPIQRNISAQIKLMFMGKKLMETPIKIDDLHFEINLKEILKNEILSNENVSDFCSLVGTQCLCSPKKSTM